jgi:hypothetical protein
MKIEQNNGVFMRFLLDLWYGKFFLPIQ